MDKIPTAPFEDRLDFYRYTSAAHHLHRARSLLNEILESEAGAIPEWKMQSLWEAFFIAYSKPFKESRQDANKRGLRIEAGDVVPDEFSGTHEAIIELRDKMFAHTDFADLVDDQGFPLNAVMIKVENGQSNFGLKIITPRAEQTEDWMDLIDALIEKASYRGTKIWNRWNRKLKLRDQTTWVLNVDHDPDVSEVLKHYP